MGDATASRSLISQAWHNAMQRAQYAPGPSGFIKAGLGNLAFFVFTVTAAGLGLATFAALITFHTPIFTWLGYPFIFLFELAQLPDATTASAGVFSGWLEMYMPAITAQGIESELTSFVLAGLAVCQLIFMSELGVVLLRSSLPLGVRDLLLIFLLRTVISLPVLILGAHIVVN